MGGSFLWALMISLRLEFIADTPLTPLGVTLSEAATFDSLYFSVLDLSFCSMVDALTHWSSLSDDPIDGEGEKISHPILLDTFSEGA